MVGFVWPLAASSRRAHEQDTREKGICRAVTSFFCRRAAPRQKRPPRGVASRRRGVGAFFSAGPPQGKNGPLGVN
ncbi:hypothetical protein ANDA3_2574 [plant metagenome]|uniref:Uncharacterized protein n=1 Tax=plant metagenome TaxID=1297885 RepID=A0A484Q799_9ZZZZ